MLSALKPGQKAKLLRALALFIGSCFVGQASANDGIYSETSHAIGGAVAAGVFTWAADSWWPEHRALVGFATSAAMGIFAEVADKRFSALDAGANALGAAIGAAITDEFLLAPVIRREVGHASYMGLVLIKKF